MAVFRLQRQLLELQEAEVVDVSVEVLTNMFIK